jgi:WD40 repeat protein
VGGAQFSRDESHVLTWSDGTLARLWDVTRPEPLQTFKHDGRVRGAQFSRDESRVLTWSIDKTARLWDVTKHEPLQTFAHDDAVWGAQFSRDESHVLTWSTDKTARLWDVTKSEPLQTFKHDDSVRGAQFSRDESRVLTWSGRAQVWDVASGALILSSGSDVQNARFNDDESRLLTISQFGSCLWESSELLGDLTADERILELEVRSKTTLNKFQTLRTLSSNEWQAKSDSEEYAKVKEKLAARKGIVAQTSAEGGRGPAP